MITKIYIAGKVSGENFQEATLKFAQAQQEIEALGYEVVSPLEIVNDGNASWIDAMKLCIKSLVDCDAVLLLPDYRSSKGALLENRIALQLELTIFKDLKLIPKLIKS